MPQIISLQYNVSWDMELFYSIKGNTGWSHSPKVVSDWFLCDKFAFFVKIFIILGISYMSTIFT